jgi:hypothetical protein
VNSGRITAAATITLTTMVATDSWVTKLRQRLDTGASATVPLTLGTLGIV